MRNLPKRPSPLTQLDRFPANRRATALVLLLVCTAWFVWSRVYVDWEVQRIALSRDNRFPIETQPLGLYETWNSTADFGTSAEYLAFIGEQHQPHISDGQLIERSLPETRHLFCILRHYPQRVPHERFSIIITFDETASRSALIRAIVSVLRRTPDVHLGEIIVVNDADADGFSFLRRLHHKIRYVRRQQQQRFGASGARQMAAIEYAQFKYLLFLDAFSEVNVGWLPPILYRLQANPNGGALISPALDVLDAQTWIYRPGKHWLRAGFDWRLRAQWFQRAPKEWETELRGRNETFPFLSPTTAGGTFAVSREWFTRIGGFERTLLPETGTGYALELSLRAWMCGGHVEIMPCSRVGHLPEEARLNNASNEEVNNRMSNARLIAETWLGIYRPLFYEHAHPEASAMPIIVLPKAAWNKQRRLQCYPFKWYLETVFPELGLRSDTFAALGELLQAGRCARPDRNQSLAVHACQPSGISTATWTLHRSGHITPYNRTESCLGAANNTMITLLNNCDIANGITNRWAYNANHTLVHLETGQCLDLLNARTAGSTALALHECQLRARRSQIWHFTVTLS